MIEKILEELQTRATYIEQKDQLMIDLPQVKAVLENLLKDQDREYEEYIVNLQKQLNLLTTTVNGLTKY